MKLHSHVTKNVEVLLRKYFVVLCKYWILLIKDVWWERHNWLVFFLVFSLRYDLFKTIHILGSMMSCNICTVCHFFYCEAGNVTLGNNAVWFISFPKLAWSAAQENRRLTSAAWQDSTIFQIVETDFIIKICFKENIMSLKNVKIQKVKATKKTSTTPKQLIKDKIYKINVIKRLEKEQKSGTLYMFFLT